MPLLVYQLGKEDYYRVLSELAEEWARCREIIDESLRKIVGKLGDDYLPGVVKHILEGGKRFRGFLTILMAKALGASAKDALDAAVAIELVQAASLAIDDIIDKDQYRRGKRAAWMLYGVERTVLSSLLLIPFAQRIVEKLGFTALFHVIRAWELTVRGEVMDSFLGRKLGPESYIPLIERKTGALFKLSTILGALSAGVKDKELVENAGLYGLKLGIAYQITDDIADYTNAMRGKKKLGPGEELFIKWAKSLDPDNPIEAAKKYISQVIEEAREHLKKLPLKDPKYEKMLELLPYFITKKLLEETGLTASTIIELR